MRLIPLVKVAVLCLFVGGAWFGFKVYRASQFGFPLFLEGQYGGVIRLRGEESTPSEEFPFYLRRRSESEFAFIAPLADGLDVGPLVIAPRLGQGPRKLLPIVISGRERKVTLRGEGDCAISCKGEAEETSGLQREGSWTLARLNQDLPSPLGSDELLERLEAREKEQRLRKLEIAISSEMNQIRQLEGAFHSGDALRQEATSRMDAQEREFDRIDQSLRVTKDNLSALEKRLQTARQITQYGRLVALSRESLNHDYAWIGKTVAALNPVLSAEFQEQYERAQRISALTSDIEKVKAEIQKLRGDFEDESVQDEP